MHETTERVRDRQAIEALYDDFLLDIPREFEDIRDEQMIVIKSFADNTATGMIAGYIPDGTGFCRIHIVYLVPEHRGISNIRMLLEALIREARKEERLSSVIWEYHMEKRDGADPYFKVCKGLKDITAKAEVLCHNFEIDLKKMISAQPRFKYCGEEFLQRGNLELIRCTDIDEARRGMVEAMLAGGDELMRSLSPFDGTVQNKDNSLFLIDKKKDEVIGWVICRDKEEGCIEIARLYVISDGRRKATGVFFAGYMLRRLASSYDRGVAKVMADNRPMLAFIRNVFSESIRESSDKRMVLTWR